MKDYFRGETADRLFKELVEERKTGKWVSINEYLNHLQNETGEQYAPSSLYNATPFCNQCWTSHDRKSNFCPNCGAKMEG